MKISIPDVIGNRETASFAGVTGVSEWINRLAQDNSRLAKEEVIKQALMSTKIGDSSAMCFLLACNLAYNPYLTYNIKQVPQTENLTNKSNPWPAFWQLLTDAATRKITGHALRDSIIDMSEQFDSNEWNQVCRGIILKDLRCGISDKTFNKVVKGTEWTIAVFSCQLANDSEHNVNHLKSVKRIESKLDGVRVLAVVSEDSVVLYSRTGKQLTNFPHIEQALFDNRQFRSAIDWQIGGSGKSFVLDGEVVGNTFQTLMQQVHRKSNAVTDDTVFNVFDIIPLSSFTEGHWNMQLRKRVEILSVANKFLTENDPIKIVSGVNVDLSTNEGHDAMHRLASDAVKAGFEGIMIKDVESPYECRRSNFWLKWKPFIDVSLSIIAVEEGTGKYENKLGALVCQGVDAGKEIIVNVGSGFSDKQRDDMWESKEQLLGHIVEIRADSVTQNKDGTYSLRFPTFLRFRGFDPNEKI